MSSKTIKQQKKNNQFSFKIPNNLQLSVTNPQVLHAEHVHTVHFKSYYTLDLQYIQLAVLQL
jgi:hypothetical protein